METQPETAGRIWSRHDAFSTTCGGLIALAAAIGVGRFVYTPILPAMMDALGLSRSAAGLIASANFAGYLIGALLAAWPNLAGPRRAWLLGSLTVSAITTGGMALGQSLATFLVLRFIGGAASAVVLVFASAIVLESLTDTRHAALHFAGVGVGVAVSAVLVAGLIHIGQSWQSLWLGAGALSLLAVVGVALLIRDGTAPSIVGRREAAWIFQPRLVRLIAAYGLFGFGYVITATFIVVIVRGTPALSAMESVIWIVFGVAAAPSVTGWSRISARLGIPVAFALACVVEACGVLASVVWPSEGGVFLAAILVGGTFMGLTALGLVRARTLAGGDPRRALALMTSAFGLGQIVGPVFAGALSDQLGSFVAPSAAAAVALVVAAGLALR